MLRVFENNVFCEFSIFIGKDEIFRSVQLLDSLNPLNLVTFHLKICISPQIPHVLNHYISNQTHLVLFGSFYS